MEQRAALPSASNELIMAADINRTRCGGGGDDVRARKQPEEGLGVVVLTGAEVREVRGARRRDERVGWNEGEWLRDANAAGFVFCVSSTLSVCEAN